MGYTLLLAVALVFLFLSSGVGTVSADENNIAVRGENVTITVTLLQNGTYGNPVPNQRIEFYDQTNNLLLGVDNTDINGVASIDWSIPIDYGLGPITVNATFRGNETLFLVPSYQCIILNILASTEIMLLDVPTVLAPGDVLSFSAILLDDTSNPLDNRILRVFSDDILLATTVTNITGGATFSIHCNDSWSILGENNIQITHDQDIENCYERTEKTFIVELHKIETLLESDFSLDSVTLNDSMNFEVELGSFEGGISDNIEVLLDGNHLLFSTTDISGIGTIHITINNQFTLGHHSVSLIYHGSERYSVSSLMIEFDVISPAIFDIKKLTSVVIGSDIDFILSLSDILGRPIEGMLTISDISNGRNISHFTPIDTIDITVKFPILGPVGLHNMIIEIANPFVSNSSITYKIEVWSQPEFTLQYSNVLHFASPNQELTFIVQLTDWSGNISFQSIQLLCNDQIIATTTTEENGIAIITTYASSYEGEYNLSIVYPLNTTRYELSTKLDYHLTVSISIPLVVELDYYKVIHPLQEVEVHIHLLCLNGSFIEGIKINLNWQSTNSSVVTQQGGIAVIHLPVPATCGNYSLYYNIDSTQGLLALAGAIVISISLIDALNSQGIGINGFIIGILSSFTIVAIPLIRQKFLVM
jgi:hypothetical protein